MRDSSGDEKAMTLLKTSPAIMMEEKPVWIVWANSDLTEGRGMQLPIAACWSKTTAKRLSKKRDVQGSNATVKEMLAFQIQGSHYWYTPCIIQSPTKEDEETDKKREAKLLAIARVKELGITEKELSDLLTILKE